MADKLNATSGSGFEPGPQCDYPAYCKETYGRCMHKDTEKECRAGGVQSRGELVERLRSEASIFEPRTDSPTLERAGKLMSEAASYIASEIGHTASPALQEAMSNSALYGTPHRPANCIHWPACESHGLPKCPRTRCSSAQSAERFAPDEPKDLAEANEIIRHLRNELASVAVAVGRSTEDGFDVDWFGLSDDVRSLRSSEALTVPDDERIVRGLSYLKHHAASSEGARAAYYYIDTLRTQVERLKEQLSAAPAARFPCDRCDSSFGCFDGTNACFKTPFYPESATPCKTVQVGWAKLGTWSGQRYIQEVRRVDEGQNERYHHPVFIATDRRTEGK